MAALAAVGDGSGTGKGPLPLADGGAATMGTSMCAGNATPGASWTNMRGGNIGAPAAPGASGGYGTMYCTNGRGAEVAGAAGPASCPAAGPTQLICAGAPPCAAAAGCGVTYGTYMGAAGTNGVAWPTGWGDAPAGA